MKKFKLLLSLLFFVLLITSCSFSIKVTKEEEKLEEKTEEDVFSFKLKVPDVSGMNIDDAKEILVLNGFKIGETILINEDNFEENLVIKTDPEVGREVFEDTVINLYVSTNSPYKVEDFTGKNCLEVKSMLEYLGIEVTIVEQESMLNVDSNIVHSQSVEAGEELIKGDKITLYIPVSSIYPNFIEEGYSLSDVEDFTSDYNLELVVKYEKNDNYEDGKIIYQSEKSGSPIIEGKKLVITIVKN